MLQPLILFAGGQATNHLFCTWLEWLATSSPSQVSRSLCLSDLVSYELLAGSAVSVERVFSGGRDTILLRRASLKPDTMRALMIVKHSLLLACARRVQERQLK
jgi:hypothetical protein